MSVLWLLTHLFPKHSLFLHLICSKCDKLASIFNHPSPHGWLKSNILKINVFYQKLTSRQAEESQYMLHPDCHRRNLPSISFYSIILPNKPHPVQSWGCFYWVWQLAVYVNIKEAHAKYVKIRKFTIRSSKALWDVQPLLLVNYD